MGEFIIKVIGTICSMSLVGGILLWLGTKGISPEKWVAAMIGFAESINITVATWLMIVGVSGLIGLFISVPVVESGKSKWLKIKKINPDTIKRDTPLADAIYYINFRKWPKENSLISMPQDERTNILKAQNELMQATKDGFITIWGNRRADAPSEKINPDYWDRCQLKPAYSYRNLLEDNCTISRRGGQREKIYNNLQTSKSEVEKYVHR